MTTNVNKDKLRDGRYVVFGAGLSGLAAARLLNSYGRRVLLCDEQTPDNMDDQLAELCHLSIDFQFGSWSPGLLEEASALILSPGIPLDHDFVQAAQDRGLPVLGELELGATLAQPPIFAITGTNGKTTTTALISHILQHCGFQAPACGNIGRAFCDTMLELSDPTRETVMVAEVSSYQLETINDFHPAAAWLLNLTPDHLDRHGDMAGYQSAKYRITQNQTEDDALVLNADDPRVMALAAQTKAEVFTFSRNRQVANGAFLKDGKFWLCRGNTAEPFPLLYMDEVKLPGWHNVENILAASLVTFFCDLNPEEVAEAIRTFPGVPHRIEFVCESDDVTYFNDSKATNLDALGMALRAFDRPLVLIAGGYDSGAPFELLGEKVGEVCRQVIAVGESAPRIADAWQHYVPVESVQTLSEATHLSIDISKPGESVLLSPGCKSFDEFKNFEERGHLFKAILMDSLMGIDYSA